MGTAGLQARQGRRSAGGQSKPEPDTSQGNPGQDDNQSQGDVDLSTSDTTLRRKGGYRRDSGIRI